MILAVVLSYYPERDLLIEDINSFINSVDKILIWENTPIADREKYRFVDNEKVIYVESEENSITKGLNYAYSYALNNGYDYLLTMDQDSVWEDFDFFLKRTIYNPVCPEGIWGPCINTRGNNDTFEKKRYLISSGILQKVSVIEKIGGWYEDFRIEAFDLEYGYHAKSLGIYSYQIGGCMLKHTLGSPTVKKVFGKSISLLNYSPNRLYEMFRNHVIIIRKYKETKILRKKFIHYWLRVRLASILFFESNKLEKVCAVFRGLYSGLTDPVLDKEM